MDDYFYVVYFIYVKVNRAMTGYGKNRRSSTNGVLRLCQKYRINFSQASIIRSTVTFGSTYEAVFFLQALLNEYGYFVLVRYLTRSQPQDPNSYLIKTGVMSVTGAASALFYMSGSVGYKYIEPQLYSSSGSTGIAKSVIMLMADWLLMNDKPAIFKSFAGVLDF